MNLEEIKLYLPKFLSQESEKELYSEIRLFLGDVSKNRYYTTRLEKTPIIYQGDCLINLPVYNYYEKIISETKCIVISNTCDIDLSNPRNMPPFIAYCPLINLSKYEDLLNTKGITKQSIESHINAIKKQEVTQMFYLPKSKNLEVDSIALLDKTFSCPNYLIQRSELESSRVFTLSDFGAYLFILKLSIHFTRIQDKVERGTTH